MKCRRTSPARLAAKIARHLSSGAAGLAHGLIRFSFHRQGTAGRLILFDSQIAEPLFRNRRQRMTVKGE